MEFSLFVGNLSSAVDDDTLFRLFAEKYKSCRGARVCKHPDGTPKEFGFVRFMSETDQQLALIEMNKVELRGKEMTIKLAHPKHQKGAHVARNEFPSSSYTGNFPNNMYMNNVSGLYSNRTWSHQSSRGHRRSRSPVNKRSPPAKKHFIEPVDPPSVVEHNEHMIDTEWDFQTALDSARFSKCLVPADIRNKDLAVMLYGS